MNKYPFYYEVRFKAFKYDEEKEQLEYVRPITRIFQDKTPLENRKDAFEAFDEFLSYIKDRLYQTKRGNYIIEQPAFVSQKLKKIDPSRFENLYAWLEKKNEYREDISLYLIINDDTIVKDLESSCCSKTNEYLIHKVASYQFEEQDVVDNLETIEVPLYENFKIDISNMKKTVYHYGLDYSESGEDEESGAKRTILSTPFVWKSKWDYDTHYIETENDRRLNELENLLQRNKNDNDISDNKEDKWHDRIIKAGEKGITYEGLFAKYLDGARDIVLIDPQIKTYHQQKNFLDFISLIRDLNKYNLSKINLKLITEDEVKKENESKGLESKLFFDGIVETLRSIKDPIQFSYEFSKEEHDRSIETENWMIDFGKGLDIYARPTNSPIENTMEKQFQEYRTIYKSFKIRYKRKNREDG